MILELRKPLYGWRSAGEHFDLFLSDDVKEWLAERDIQHETHVSREERDMGDGAHTYLIFYLDILDDKEAMLFKLTWM